MIYNDNVYSEGFGNKNQNFINYEQDGYKYCVAYPFEKQDMSYYIFTESKKNGIKYERYTYTSYCQSKINYFTQYLEKMAVDENVDLKIEVNNDYYSFKYGDGLAENRVIIITLKDTNQIENIAKFMVDLNYEVNFNINDDYYDSKYNMRPDFVENDRVYIEVTKTTENENTTLNLPIARNQIQRDLYTAQYYKDILESGVK